jgi:hypothetical protein
MNFKYNSKCFLFIILTVSFGKIEFKKRWEIELWEAIGERHRWLIRMYLKDTLNTNQEQVEKQIERGDYS